MNPDTTHFILVRHGETTANRADVVGGSSDDPLTETGHEQARKVGAYLKIKAANAVALYASPLSRAWDTASHIGESLGMTPQKKEHLVEWHVGDWEGIKYTEIAEQGEFVLEDLANLDFRPPSGEALGEVQARMLKSLCEIAKNHPGEQVVVVSHGTALALALAEIKGDNLGAWMGYRLENCSVSELMLGPEPEVICLNETSHL